MKPLITKVLATFILSQIMPAVIMFTLPNQDYISSYMGGILFDTMLAGMMCIIYAIVFIDQWKTGYHKFTLRTIKYGILIALGYQILPSLLSAVIYFSPDRHFSCSGAYEAGWLINAFVSSVIGYFYFDEKMKQVYKFHDF